MSVRTVLSCLAFSALKLIDNSGGLFLWFSRIALSDFSLVEVYRKLFYPALSDQPDYLRSFVGTYKLRRSNLTGKKAYKQDRWKKTKREGGIVCSLRARWHIGRHSKTSHWCLDGLTRRLNYHVAGPKVSPFAKGCRIASPKLSSVSIEPVLPHQDGNLEPVKLIAAMTTMVEIAKPASKDAEVM